MRLAICILVALGGTAAASEAKVVHDDRGDRLVVDGADLLVRGMNWGYTPIGSNYSYSLWAQPDAFVERVLDRDMRLLRAMGVNAIRQGADIPPRWVAWIHERYGIYTMINNLVGKYDKTDYADPDRRRALVDAVVATVEKYRATDGVLMWLLGNENNYGLGEFTSGDDDTARATSLYSLYGEAIRAIKAIDTAHPVAIANGDLQYVDLIATYCKELDILGANVYRGASARDFFQVIHDKLGIPAMFTEFGADAYDAHADHEDAAAQAEYLRAQWQEIYEQSWGKGLVGNAIGGFIFQWTDGWWKAGQEKNLDIHDTTASWPNDAYPSDFVAGQNNMNEEWFGIAAIEDQDADGFYKVQPRVAYYVLRAAFELEPYAETTTLEQIRAHFALVTPDDYADRYESRQAAASVEKLSRLRVAGMRMRLESNVTVVDRHSDKFGAARADHTESLFVDVALQPTPRVTGTVTVNFVGNAAQNRLDHLYWENKPDRVALYGAALAADYPSLGIEGYYRVGHGHWGYEGDFFGLYREAYYGTAIDIYHANAPLGMVVSGKRALGDFKIAFGPEVYWGANPTVIGKWSHRFGPIALTAMHQEDLADRAGAATTSSAGYEPLTRRSTLSARIAHGHATLDLGGLFAAPSRVGRPYTFTHPSMGPGYGDSGQDVYTGTIAWADTLGARARLAYDGGAARWYVEGGYRGLVADAGTDQTVTWTGWSMKASGRGNQMNGLGGLLLTLGNVQIAPNLLYQRPIVGPAPAIPDRYDAGSGMYYPGVAPRNTLTDPFAVLDNRETVGGELLLIYDPTPATWYWSWDRDRREDAGFAASLDTVYRRQPTSRDASLVILEDGSLVPAIGAPPAHDVWQSTLAWSSARQRLRLSGTFYAGQDQARAGDPRLITRFGGSLALRHAGLAFATDVRLRDWGPYDYHKDFNLTYPLQWYGDLSYGFTRAAFGLADARLGARWQFRLLDGYSEGYVGGNTYGSEAEVLTYLELGL